MTGDEIMTEIVRELGDRADAFFGRDRSPEMTERRIAAARRLADAGVLQKDIGFLLKRDRTMVIYYLRPATRDRRSQYHAEKWALKKTEREAAAAIREADRLAAKAAAKLNASPPVAKASRLWSDEDTATAARMFACGATDDEFRKALGRGRRAAEMRLKDVESRRRLESRANSVATKADDLSRVPAEILAEARARVAAPRSLTAWAFGDPPPGWSSLDHRNSASSEARS